jgi:hypothetical protein
LTLRPHEARAAPFPKQFVASYHDKRVALEMPKESDNSKSLAALGLHRLDMSLPDLRSQPIDGFLDYACEKWKH